MSEHQLRILAYTYISFADTHAPPTPTVSDEVEQLGRNAEEDDIRIETHPRTGKATQYYDYDTYSNMSARTPASNASNARPAQNEREGRTPWFPFASRVDFELAEWMHDLRLNQKEMNRLLKIIGDIRDGSSGSGAARFTLTSAAHVRKLWKIASDCNDFSVSILWPYNSLNYG